MSDRQDRMLKVMHRLQEAATMAVVAYYTDSPYSEKVMMKSMHNSATALGLKLVPKEDGE